MEISTIIYDYDFGSMCFPSERSNAVLNFFVEVRRPIWYSSRTLMLAPFIAKEFHEVQAWFVRVGATRL